MVKNSILLVLFLQCFSCYAQIEVDWKSNIEFYSHGSSNYVSAQPPIDFVLLDSMIFVVTQNGNLSCLNKWGEVLWKKKLIYGDFISGGVNIEIDKANNLVITTGSELEKYSILGDLMWSTEIKFSGKIYFINSVFVSKSNFIYVTLDIRGKYSHSSTKSYLLKYNENGKLIWKQSLSKQKSSYEYSPRKKIIEIDQNLYLFGNTAENYRDFTSIYNFNENGKLIKKFTFEGFTTSIQHKDGILYSLTINGEYNTDFVNILSFDKNLDLLKEKKKYLPQNGFFSNENYTLDTHRKTITEVFYTKIPASIYTLNDFIVTSDTSFTLLGSSNRNLWLAHMVNDSISLDWELNYVYHNNYEKYGHYQEFNLAQAHHEQYYVSGLCVYQEDLGTNWIKLFLFSLKLKE